MCVLALIGYLAFPTYPTYDSFYALLWGRDLLHAHLPDFQVYRGPTEHPLAIAFGVLCSIFGEGGARLMVLGSIASFVAAVAGVYRVGRLSLRTARRARRGAAAAEPLLRREPRRPGLPGHLLPGPDPVGAGARARAPPARHPGVRAAGAAAGLLRPDAWVLSGAYWLWCCWPALQRLRGRAGARGTAGLRQRRSMRRVLAYLALAASAPLIWFAFDAIVTGNPLYSLTATSGLAQELERTQGFSGVLASVWNFSVRIDKLPVLLGAIAGAALAAFIAPRRAIVPLVALALLYARVPARGRRGRVGDRPLPARRGDARAAVLRGLGRRLVDARAGLAAASRVDRLRARAGPLRDRRRSPPRSASRSCGPRSPSTRTSTRGSRPPCTAPASPPPCAAARCCRCPTTS